MYHHSATGRRQPPVTARPDRDTRAHCACVEALGVSGRRSLRAGEPERRRPAGACG